MPRYYPKQNFRLKEKCSTMRHENIIIIALIKTTNKRRNDVISTYKKLQKSTRTCAAIVIPLVLWNLLFFFVIVDCNVLSTVTNYLLLVQKIFLFQTAYVNKICLLFRVKLFVFFETNDSPTKWTKAELKF